MGELAGLPSIRWSLRGLDEEGDEAWLIRGISRKLYRCPGCHGEIEIGAEHTSSSTCCGSAAPSITTGTGAAPKSCWSPSCASVKRVPASESRAVQARGARPASSPGAGAAEREPASEPLALYARIGRTYCQLGAGRCCCSRSSSSSRSACSTRSRSTLDVDSLDLGSGARDRSALVGRGRRRSPTTGLLGEVFYTGAVAISLTHPARRQAAVAARNRPRGQLRAADRVDLIYGVVVAVGLVAPLRPRRRSSSSASASPRRSSRSRSARRARRLRRSVRLVRGHFWLVLWVLVPIEIVGDALDRTSRPTSSTSLLGGSLLAEWLADAASNIVLTPFYAVAAVLLTLDLIAAKDGDAAAATLGPGPSMITTASIFTDFWNDQIVADDKQGLFLVLVGFILSFAFIRMSTRLMRSPKVPWWPGSVVSDSGVHLHHLVFGIVTMMIAGAARLRRPRRQPLHRDLRLRLRRRRRADDRRVRALGLPRRRLLGRGGAQLDRRHRDRRRGDVPDPDRLQPVQLRDRLGRPARSAASSAPRSSSAWSRSASSSSGCMHGIDRLLRPPDRDLRRLPDRQAGLALGAAALRRAATRRSRPRPRSASRPTAAPSASRTPSATSSAASRAREWRRSATRHWRPGAKPPTN